jgi:hypothetical protein
MDGLVAIASIDTLALFNPPFSPKRSSGGGGDSFDLIRLFRNAFLTEYKPRSGCIGRDQMQRSLSKGPVAAARRGLSIDRQEVGIVRPGLAHPASEGGREQARLKPFQNNVQPTVAWHAVFVRQITPEEVDPFLALVGDDVMVLAV